MQRLVDIEHPLVQELAKNLTAEKDSRQGKLKRIFRFVRDDILFGFPPEGDFVKASQTIERGYGQCNTKGILFLALSRAAGIPARLHYSQISKEIQHGFFTGWFYKLMPEELTHSWVEVKLDGEWRAIDSYINDLNLHYAAVRELSRKGWQTGFSVSTAAGDPSAELVLDNRHFTQMAAVVGDQGTTEEPGAFFNSPAYLNRPGLIGRWLYRLYLPIANRRVRNLRTTICNAKP